MVDFVLIVCGFGRCGSSLVMQMLDAADYPIFMPEVATYPAYEINDIANRVDELMPQAVGYAVKHLDPQRFGLADGVKYKFIWLDRNRRNQAKSQIKFFKAMTGFKIQTTITKWVKLYKRDLPLAMLKMNEHGNDVLKLRFETILKNPEEVAQQIADHIGQDLDTKAMAAQVIKRTPGVYPGLLEVELMNAYEQTKEQCHGQEET